ncbi:MAG TPA: hypothetical protein P5567_06180 [Kiritimatiellia bacterium]|nr:hypothetical protein [Kiritimatiellia bacterium]HSA17169.1 hypothetical protein [Kiritimatiellia bacterium]
MDTGPAIPPRAAERETGSPRLEAAELLLLARGLLCVFWGIPLSLLMFFGTLELRLAAGLRVPVFAFGLMLIFLGVVHMSRVKSLSPRWARRTRETQLILLILVYLAPFVYWWQAMPHVPYYCVNVLAIVVVSMWGFLAVNRLAAEIGNRFGEHAFVIEARLSGWLAVVFLLGPGTFAVLRTILATASIENSGLATLVLVPYLVPRWMYALTLLPFTMTMMMVWRAKELCLRAIRQAEPV